MSEFRTILDKPLYIGHIRNLDKMITELSKYMTETEIDQCIGFMHTLRDTKHDINPSPEDCKTQIQLLIGQERFLEVCQKWQQENQKFLSVFGTMKFKCKNTGKYYDGLDPEDNPTDYEKIYI